MPLDLTVLPALRARIMAAVEEEANAILDVSNQRIPVETATAQKSGRVAADGDTVYVTYGRDDDQNPKGGNPSNAYIEVLHEDMERKHPHGGQAKFLQSAADDAQGGLAERIAEKASL